jgi:anti-anti-sigma factor
MHAASAVVTIMATSFRFFSIEQIGDATIARPVDPHLQGTAVAELIKLELTQIFETTGCKTAIVDLHNVKLVSSSVISSLLGVKRHLSVNGVPFVMCGMSDSLRYVFRALNMDGSVFKIVDDVDEALSSGDKSPAFYSNVCDRLSPPDDENA